MKIIGIAGGSGSGKTTFARMLTESIGRERVAILAQDSYYIDQSDRFDTDGGAVNFDHPQSIDWPLLAQHLRVLKNGDGVVQMPIYDFVTHKRLDKSITIEPKPYVVVDGILILVEKMIRDQMDYKIFIETPEDVRFSRRLKRDVLERGRTEVGVRAQFYSQVKPMHDQFVEPTAAYADRRISGEMNFQQVLPEVIEVIESRPVRS